MARAGIGIPAGDGTDAYGRDECDAELSQGDYVLLISAGTLSSSKVKVGV